MYLVWPETDPWKALQQAIVPALTPALTAAGPIEPLTLAEGAASGPLMTLSEAGLRLSAALLGPAVHAGPDQRWLETAPAALAPLALDRWRRCAGTILEGVLLRRLARQLSVSPADLPLTWWTLGLVAEEVDRLNPQLGWLWQSATRLRMAPGVSMHDEPRRGAWFFRWRQQQERPLTLTAARAPTISPEEWAAFGAWCRDPAGGPGAQAPIPLPLSAPRGAPSASLPPMSHHPMRWSAGPAGLRVIGGAMSPPVRLSGGEAVTTVLGSVSGGLPVLTARPCQLVGRWTLRTGQANQRLGVAEGIELIFHPGGTLEITLANAWMGPADAESLSLAKQIGASGSGQGRWKVLSLDEDEGAGVVTLTDLDINQVSLHPRRARMRRFALPAGEGQLERVRRLLGQLAGSPVTFTTRDGELLLDGALKNYTVQIRLAPT